MDGWMTDLAPPAAGQYDGTTLIEILPEGKLLHLGNLYVLSCPLEAGLPDEMPTNDR